LETQYNIIYYSMLIGWFGNGYINLNC